MPGTADFNDIVVDREIPRDVTDTHFFKPS